MIETRVERGEGRVLREAVCHCHLNKWAETMRSYVTALLLTFPHITPPPPDVPVKSPPRRGEILAEPISYLGLHWTV